MGRHGAAESRRRPARISLPVAVIGVLVLAAIGFGIWLWSLKSVTDPIDAKPVDAYAVVVSSPSCTSGAGTTVIDLSSTPAVRSSLSGCGQRVGARLAVQYLDGHPDQVRLAGTTIAHNSPASRWLPIAIVAAGLLAVIATVALLIERRQSRHAGAATRVTVAQLRAGGVPGRPAVAASDPAASSRRSGAAVAGSAAVVAGSADAVVGYAGAVPVPSAVVSPAAGPPAVGTPAAVTLAAGRGESEDPLRENPDSTSRIAMAAFPGASVHPFRPSEITVEEDLFTHRGPEAPDR